MTRTLSIKSERLNSSSVRVLFPPSILLISSTSFMSESRYLLEELIFSRHSFTFSLLSIFDLARAVMPMIEFIGVLMSWLILERKSDFAALAISACCKASFISCSLMFLSVTSMSIPAKTQAPPSFVSESLPIQSNHL